jgi:hypothetical protein
MRPLLRAWLAGQRYAYHTLRLVLEELFSRWLAL